MQSLKCFWAAAYFLAIAPMNHVTVCADTATNWTHINEICGVSYSDRIIGGINARLGQYPWIAQIGIKRKEVYKEGYGLFYDCGGALVHPRYVLTAAHCAAGFENQGEGIVNVKLGEYNTETEIDCEVDQCAEPLQVIKAKAVFVPTEYGDSNFKHDIALMELSEEANITTYVLPVCLPLSETLRKNNLMGKIVEVAGWGTTDVDDTDKVRSTILQTVNLHVVAKDECLKLQDAVSTSDYGVGQFCVGGLKGKDSCNGDSGGPLVKVMQSDEFDDPRYVLFGLVSFGMPSCGKFDLPAVYTNVSHYLPWILQHIQ